MSCRLLDDEGLEDPGESEYRNRGAQDERHEEHPGDTAQRGEGLPDGATDELLECL
jgi:hypothetical protein